MPPLTMVPPPAQDIQAQRGPFTMADQQQQQQPQLPQEAQGPQGAAPQEPLEGQLIVATIHMRQMLKTEPALAPWVNDAISRLQSGVRTILAQRRQTGGQGMPAQSATPPAEPGAGLPF